MWMKEIYLSIDGISQSNVISTKWTRVLVNMAHEKREYYEMQQSFD